MSTVYFGYGSNLWQEQMRSRCPKSQYVGLARLTNFRWIINSRGYANIVPLSSQNDGSTGSEPGAAQPEKSKLSTVVFGLAYMLTSEDEAHLDQNEGVPWAYTKEVMTVDYWPQGTSVEDAPEQREFLVYIDRNRVDGNFKPREEYVYRMNMGIHDALKEGVPPKYIRQVLRRYITEEAVDDHVRMTAEKQSREFIDDSLTG